MCAKDRNRDSKDYLRYLKDELSKQERHDLERSLEADPFEMEAMEGLESIAPEKAEEDILSLHASLNKRLNRRTRRAWYSIAATAASILLVGTIFLNIYDLNPGDAGSEALTEETFRKLDSDDRPSESQPEAKIATEPEAQPQAQLPSEPQTLAKSAVTEEAPAPAAKVTPEEIAEEVSEEFNRESEIADEATYDMIAEDEEILAVEAKPERSKRSASKEKMAAPVAYEAEAANAGAVVVADDQISGEISGIVLSSEDMEPLPGAVIMIEDLNSGTVADMEGRFIIPTDEKQTTVLASFIGMETEEYVLQSDSDNELVMQPDAMMLDEIVVVSHLSGKVAGVSTSSRTTTQEEITQEQAAPTYSAAGPPDGYNAYRKYLNENMLFPEGYIDGEREIVVLKFTVNSNGSIGEISTLRSPEESYTREATRLLLNGPTWKPAIVNGAPMDEQVRIRIVFKK